MDLSRLFFVNPFAKFFKQARPEEESKEQEEISNSQGASQEEIISRNIQLQELKENEDKIRIELDKKLSKLSELNYGIKSARKTAEQNQKKTEELTDSLVPMQESLTGIETEINKHKLAIESITEKNSDYMDRREASPETAAPTSPDRGRARPRR